MFRFLSICIFSLSLLLLLGCEKENIDIIEEVPEAVDPVIVEVANASGFGQNLRWGGRLEAGYDWQPKGQWSLSIRAGAQTAFSDWSTDGSGQRPTSFDGMIGLRYRW